MTEDPDRPDAGGVDLMAIDRAGRHVSEDGGDNETEARRMIASIESGLREAPEDSAPLKVPFAPTEDAFYLFCIFLVENDWMKENSLIMSFPDTQGKRMIGCILKRDREFWNSPQALEHLRCRAADIDFYSIEEYVKFALEQMRRERGIKD